MPGRFRRGANIRPVNSQKHVVDIQGGAVAGTQVNNLLIDSVNTPVLATNPQQVRIGSIVNWIYLNVQAYATTAGALANAYMVIMKSPGNAIGTPQANIVGTSDAMKQVIHQEMVMMEKSINGNPRTLFEGVLRIPRGYRRFGHDDALNIGVFSPGVNIDFCIQCIYKEYY